MSHYLFYYSKNITIQLNKRIAALLRIGEKKVKVGGRVDGIHSVIIFMFGVDKADTTRKEFLAMVNENLLLTLNTIRKNTATKVS